MTCMCRSKLQSDWPGVYTGLALVGKLDIYKMILPFFEKKMSYYNFFIEE